jgi:monoterpene epsilon-lactone hydrolase
MHRQESNMSEQRDAFVQAQREGPALGGSVAEQRVGLEAVLTSVGLSEDVRLASTEVAGVPALDITVGLNETEHVILHLHGGFYRLGSARASAGLAAGIARYAGADAVALDYRLAPEHPFPAAVDDALAAYRALLERHPAERIAFSGESAGGGLVLATLLRARDAGLPMPAAAVVMSPWTDMTMSGRSIADKADADPIIDATNLRSARSDYIGDGDATDPLVSPALADLHGLPPLLVQVGSYEVLLDDAMLLAAAAARDDVEVVLQVESRLTHIFQAFAPLIPEGDRALQRAGDFLRERLG